MNIETIRDFLGWCTLINFGILLLMTVAFVLLRPTISRLKRECSASANPSCQWSFTALYRVLQDGSDDLQPCSLPRPEGNGVRTIRSDQRADSYRYTARVRRWKIFASTLFFTRDGFSEKASPSSRHCFTHRFDLNSNRGSAPGLHHLHRNPQSKRIRQFPLDALREIGPGTWGPLRSLPRVRPWTGGSSG
jgi:hypothetical protein